MTQHSSGTQPTILLVDDDHAFRCGLRERLEDGGYVALEAADGKLALEMLDSSPVDLVLLDLHLPRIQGMEVLRRMADSHPTTPVVILSERGSIPTAVQATKLGAVEFLEKDYDEEQTLRTVREALEKGRMQRQQQRSLDEAYARYGMIGTSPAMQRVYQLIDRAAATEREVLILGRSGTGKERVAQAIHSHSTRPTPRFVPVNCAGIPEQLIESELFGHERGAFTGAFTQHAGLFEQASGGTLFLDEIGDMSLMTQAKVLRALEERQIRRVGGRTPIAVDFRLITATNRNLEAETADGNFREDLYFRLDVLRIELPRLREHREDIPALAEFFLERCCREEGRCARRFTASALRVLLDHDWPGNVRELEHVVARLVALGDGAPIDAREVQRALRRPVTQALQRPDMSLAEARHRFERDYIHTTLIAHDFKIQETARALGINRSSLWKKVKQLGIEVE